jgi:hypothetical protein
MKKSVNIFSAFLKWYLSEPGMFDGELKFFYMNLFKKW